MNVRKTVFSVAVATSGLLGLGQPAPAQDTCKQARGNTEQVNVQGSNVTSGSVTNAGWLNGTTLHVWGPILFPLPNVGVFDGQSTITTNQGQLKTRSLVLLNVAVLKGTVFHIIDPDASTGIFAGATGTLFQNTARTDVSGNVFTFHSEVSGQVCFAKQ